MSSNIELHNMDCLQAMANMPDNYFDLAIVDPPYFAEYGRETYPGTEISTTGIKRNRFESKRWEVPKQQYFDQLIRISKNQIIWGFNYYDCKFIGSGRIVWDKKNDKSSFSKCEIAYCSFHKKTEIFRFMWNGMLQEHGGKKKEHRIHPTQKPVALYKWILKNYAKPGDRILDTHLGSGSIAIACYDMGHDLVGYEIDKDYYDDAVNRLENHKKQLTLF